MTKAASATNIALSQAIRQTQSPPEGIDCTKVLIVFTAALFILIGIFALCDLNLLSFMFSIPMTCTTSMILGILFIALYYLKNKRAEQARAALIGTINGPELLKELNAYINKCLSEYIETTHCEKSDMKRINVFLSAQVDKRKHYENNVHSYNSETPYENSMFLTKDVFSKSKAFNIHLLIIVEKNTSKNIDLIRVDINNTGTSELIFEKVISSNPFRDLDTRLGHYNTYPGFQGCFQGISYAADKLKLG